MVVVRLFCAEGAFLVALRKKGTSMNKRHAFIMVLFSLTIIGLAITGNMDLGLAQVGVNVSRVISQDTAWTQTNSPYNLAGTVTIDSVG